MVQTVNAKNLLDKNLMMYCLPPTPQYIQNSENRSHSPFSIEDYSFIFSGELHIRDVGKSDEDVGYSCQYRDDYSGKVAFSQVCQLFRVIQI